MDNEVLEAVSFTEIDTVKIYCVATQALFLAYSIRGQLECKPIIETDDYIVVF